MWWYDDWFDWNPLAEFGRGPGSLFGSFPTVQAYPAINLWRREDEMVLTAELPGLDPKDINVSVEGDQFTLQGERKPEEMTDEVVCHRQERGAGRFVRTVRLPFEVDPEKVVARYENGVLNVTLPRAESSKPKKIAITSG